MQQPKQEIVQWGALAERIEEARRRVEALREFL